MSVAFVTMVYNDEFFLDIWLRYYRKHVPAGDLYIITHGPQPYAHEMGNGCNVIEIDRNPRNRRLDQDRFAHLSKFCSDLTASYNRVVWNDVDEIIVLDPKYGDNLVGYMDSIPREKEVITPFGLEIVHRADLESDYDYSRDMFAQRQFVRFNGWYTKPSVTGIPIIWGPDGHGSSHDKIHLDDRLYTFHLKWFDQGFHINRHLDRLKLRFNDEDGNEVIVGAGSWAWSESTYLIMSNTFLRMPILPSRDSFDFAAQRKHCENTFRGGGHNKLYRISWAVDGTLHHLPERFIGMV